MSKSLSAFFYAILLVFISSCSSKEEKNYSPQEITNNLLVDEQLPIKTLSNALEWPEEIILGVDIGLIELNEEGKERLKDVFEDYTDDGKDDFIKDNNEKEWSDFVKGDWIKSETTKISVSKLNEIKKTEFKNNAIIQNKLNHFIPSYIERQTKELSSYQFSFFSIEFWKNLGQISWMHIKSTSSKISKRDIYYLEPNFIKDLQLVWQNKFNFYFSPNTAKVEMEKVLSNYQNLILIKHKYFSILSKKKIEQNSIPNLKFQKTISNSVIDIKPIISQFNLTMIDNFGLLFIELITALLIATIVNFILRRITKSENENRTHILVTFFSTGFSPLQALIGSAAFIGNIVVSNQASAKSKSTGAIINIIIGVLLMVFSYIYISKTQNKIEEEINNNFKTNFSSYFNKSSFQLLDDLNLNTELFFTSI